MRAMLEPDFLAKSQQKILKFRIPWKLEEPADLSSGEMDDFDFGFQDYNFGGQKR